MNKGGFFSNLFSKQTCAFCGKEVGALSRKRLSDKNYICKECEKNCSAFLDPKASKKNYKELFRYDQIKYKAGADALKAFGSLAKAKMSGNEEDMENAKENYVLDLYIEGLYEIAYNEDKESAKEDNSNYVETKFGKYDGYTYEDSDGDIEGYILLDSKDEYCNIRIMFNLYLNDEDAENNDLQAIYQSSSIQDILNKIEFKS